MARHSFNAPDARYWEDSWAASDATSDRAGYLAACRVFDPVLRTLLPSTPGLQALEVGCYPGGFMHYLNQRWGYTVSGIDIVPGVDTLAATLAEEGVRVGEVVRADFCTEPPRPSYDLVCSFGFIEHFDDPAAIITRHAAWVRPGGLLVVTVPNFRGGQWLLHRQWDRTSLETHNLAAMSPGLLRTAFAFGGVAPLHVRRFGTCEFWVEPDEARSARASRTAGRVAGVLGKAGSLAKRVAGPCGVPNPILSPFLVAVGRKL